MVVRVAGYGYQKGFGGHFHNDNAVAVLRDIPGLVVASPARRPTRRRCCGPAWPPPRVDGTVSVFLEPIALYHTARSARTGRRRLARRRTRRPSAGPRSTSRSARRGCTATGGDLLIVTWANGLHLSLRVARRLAPKGIGVRVLDLRWLAPLPVDDLVAAGAATGRVLVVDETRRTGGVGEGVVTALVERGFAGPIGRVASRTASSRSATPRRPCCWASRRSGGRPPPRHRLIRRAGRASRTTPQEWWRTKMRLAPDAPEIVSAARMTAAQV